MSQRGFKNLTGAIVAVGYVDAAAFVDCAPQPPIYHAHGEGRITDVTDNLVQHTETRPSWTSLPRVSFRMTYIGCTAHDQHLRGVDQIWNWTGLEDWADHSLRPVSRDCRTVGNFAYKLYGKDYHQGIQCRENARP